MLTYLCANPPTKTKKKIDGLKLSKKIKEIHNLGLNS